jgi:4-amino-4-deoxy-L-arabinose transferase-like glycosyltransferase
MKPQSRSQVFLATCVVLFAASLRLSRLDLVEFKFDEATTARSALAIARDAQLPALGMVSSRGPHNPPLMSYLLALPFGLSRDPRIAAAWTAGLGVVAVSLSYTIGRLYFGRRVGLVAALLFAASPWAVFHSRKIWAQNVPAFTLLFVACLLAYAVRRRNWAIAGALACAGGLVGLHLGGVAFFPILVVVAVLYRRDLRAFPVALGLAALLAVLSPYLIYDSQHGFANLRAFGNLAGSGGRLDAESLRVAAAISGGAHFQDLTGEKYAEFVRTHWDFSWVDDVEGLVFFGGLVWLATSVILKVIKSRNWSSHGAAARTVLLVWLAVPVLLLAKHSEPVYPHALSLLYPAPQFVVALALVDFAAALDRRRTCRGGNLAWAAVLVFVAVLVGWQVYLQQALLSFVDVRNTVGGHGAPVKYVVGATERAELLAADADSELIVLLPGSDPSFDNDAAVFDVLLSGPHRLVDGRQALVLPDHNAVFLAGFRAEPLDTMLDELPLQVAGPNPVRMGSSDTYRYYLWRPSAFPVPHLGESVAAQWAAGPRSLGYDWTGDARPGGTILLTHIWRVEFLPPERTDLHWFNHVIAASGARVGQLDGVGLSAADWRLRDTVFTWFEIPIEQGVAPPPYVVRTGLYTFPEVVNNPIVDAAANPVAEFVELGPIGESP